MSMWQRRKKKEGCLFFTFLVLRMRTKHLNPPKSGSFSVMAFLKLFHQPTSTKTQRGKTRKERLRSNFIHKESGKKTRVLNILFASVCTRTYTHTTTERLLNIVTWTRISFTQNRESMQPDSLRGTATSPPSRSGTSNGYPKTRQ